MKNHIHLYRQFANYVIAFVLTSLGVKAEASAQQDSISSPPIINISTPNGISWSDSLCLAYFNITNPNGESFSSPIGIKFHGGSSLSFPKRSFRIEFWADESGNMTEDHALLGMRSDDDWFLLAAYNEPLRVRSLTCYDLWREIHKPYYHTMEPNAQSCVHMDYAELYLNDSYYGIYLVAEKVDRKLLKLKPFDGNIHGELYKGKDLGATTFESVPENYDNSQTIMDGFEYQYPNEIIDWSHLYEFLDFVVNSNDDDFHAEIAHRVQIDNMIDYFIFFNTINAIDNTGKNIYLARYKDNEPYFFVPWDLDASLGNYFDGTPWPEFTGILSNGLFDRLIRDKEPDGFCTKVMQRWNELRGTTLSHQHIMELYQSHVNFMKDNGLYEKEHLAWPEFSYDSTQIDYVSEWLEKRLSWLGNCIDTLGIEEQGANEQLFGLYPNPATSQISIFSASPIERISIAKVDGRIVRQIESMAGQTTSTLQLNGIQPGMYIVTVRSNASQASLKLIVQ